MTLYINSLVIEQSGAVLNPLDMTGNYIFNVATPVNSEDAANKSYVDSTLSNTISGFYTKTEVNIISGELQNWTELRYAQSINYTDIASADLLTKIIAQNELSEILANGNSAGSYQIDMNGNRIINLATPTVSGDAVNKFYVDNLPIPTSSTSGSWVPNNSILIDTFSEEITGKRYNTIANALVYIATTTPSTGNRWAIEFSGFNTESFTIPDFVSIVGIDGSAILDGVISSNTSYLNLTPSSSPSHQGDYERVSVYNCKVRSIGTPAFNAIYFKNCNFELKNPLSAGILYADTCNFYSGDYSAGIVGAWGSEIEGGTYGNNLALQNCDIGSAWYTTFTGTGNIYFRDCYITGNNTTFAGTNTVHIHDCLWRKSSLSITASQTFNFIGGAMASSCSITVNGGSLYTHGFSTEANSNKITYVSGTWVNYGEYYDNRSGLLSANSYHTQAAIDELATRTIIVSGDLNNHVYNYTNPHYTTLDQIVSGGNTTDKLIVLTNPGTGLIVQGTLVAQNFEAQHIITITEIISGDEIIAGGLTVNGNAQLGDEVTDTISLSGRTYYAYTPLALDEIVTKEYVDTIAAAQTLQTVTNQGATTTNSVSISADLYVTGKLTVDGDIDPVSLTLTAMASSLNEPTTGYLRLYAKDDYKFYYKSFDGIEKSLGAGGSYEIKHSVVVNPDEDEITGKRYKTYANAVTYVLSQTPTITDQWAIELPAGEITELIAVYPWVRVIGRPGATILSGNVTASAPWMFINFSESIIVNCVINNLSLSGLNIGVDTQLLSLLDCDLAGCNTPTLGGLAVTFNSRITNGDYSNIYMMFIIDSMVMAGFTGTITFGAGCQFYGCEFISFGPTTLNGGQFNNCMVGSGTTCNPGMYTINGGAFSPSLTITSGNFATFYNAYVDGSMTVQSGGYLYTYGCTMPSAPTINTGGYFQNRGEYYDPRVSHLSSTEVQGAIDELAAAGGYVPNNELIVRTGALEKVGFLYNSISNALNYIDSYNTVVVNGLFTDASGLPWITTDCNLVTVAGTGHYGWYGMINPTGGSSQSISQTITLISGIQHSLHFYVKSDSSGDEPFIGSVNDGTTTFAVTGVSSSTWTRYSLDFTPASSSGTLAITKDTATMGTMDFDTIVVRQSTWEPNQNDRWTVRFAGHNMESFDIPDYVWIVGGGSGTSELAGGVITYSTNYTAGIKDCQVQYIGTMPSYGVLTFISCDIRMGGSPIGGNLIFQNCSLSSGNLTNATSICTLYNCTLGNMNLPGNAVFYNCKMDDSSSSFVGGTFNNCYIGNGNFLNGGTYVIDGGTLNKSVLVQSGYNYTLRNVDCLDNTFTVQSGGNLVTQSVINLNVIYTAGTWSSSGDLYDNRLSGLYSKEMQGAVDELKTLVDTISGDANITEFANTIIVNSALPEMVGKRYKTIQAAIDYATNAHVETGILLSSEYYTESLTLNQYSKLVGTGYTYIAGTVHSGNVSGINYYDDYEIRNCIIQLSGSSGGVGEYFYINNCRYASGTITGTLYISNCVVSGGTFYPDVDSKFIQTDFRNANLNNTANYYSCNFGHEGIDYISHGSFSDTPYLYNCNIGSWWFSYPNKDLYMYGGTINNNLIVNTSGSIAHFENVDFKGSTITINTAVTGHFYGCSNIASILGGGTWFNYGDLYDNRSSGLQAKEMQGAVDELKSIIDDRKFKYTQSTLSDTWIVPHNLDAEAVDALVIADKKKIGYNDLTLTDSASCIISFTTPMTGIAYILPYYL